MEKINAINEEQALKDWLDQYRTIVENGDFESYKSLWTDNVIWMPPNAPNLIGKQAISNFAEPYFSQYNIEYKPTIEEIKVISDFAYIRFSVVEKYTPKVGNAEPLVVTDKDLFLLRRESSGSWVGTHGIWNEANPPSQ